MSFRLFLPVILVVFISSCNDSKDIQGDTSLLSLLENEEYIPGNDAYIHSPFVTPGDRAYLVGHQDGTFPPLGWHIKGEMGGLWAHPIKLLDGFSASLHSSREIMCLSQADSFGNYPFVNKHVYSNPFGVKITRIQFSPDGQPAVVVEYSFENESDENREFLFEFAVNTDLRPTWLGERTNMINGKDLISWNNELQALVGHDSLNTWNVIIGSDEKHLRYDLSNTSCTSEVDTLNASGSITWIINIPANSSRRLTITMAGNAQGFESAKNAFTIVKNSNRRMFLEKKNRYTSIAGSSALTIDDKKLEQTFRWLKYNTDWLVQEVDGVGRGLTAGIPDYPWWFGADSEYALQGAIMVGQQETVYETIDLIYAISQSTNENGRVVHEVSSNGAVFNPGNINETPQFTSLIWRVYQWTGDLDFLKKYYPFLVRGMNWLLSETDLDGNSLPDGFGMMEIHGLDSEMIDVAAYTQKAFSDLARIAKVLGEEESAEQYQQKAADIADIIATDYWVEEFQSYADFIGTPAQADRLIKDAIHRADSLKKPWAVAELKQTQAKVNELPPDRKQGFVLHHNWVVNTPMETGIADSNKALAALESAKKYVNPFGVFVTGIDRDEGILDEEESFETNRQIFSYIGAVMTLPTGVQAIAENNYGRPDAALEYIQRMVKSFSYALPGSMYEVSPDFGMMTQAWNIYSFAVPIIHQFFGIKPQAYDRRILISPAMPSDWEIASLSNVHIGDNSLNISFKKTNRSLELSISQTQTWELVVALPYTEGDRWLINDKPVQPTVLEGMAEIMFQEKNVVLTRHR